MNEDYKSILTDIIKKQAVILGPQMAVLKARAVSGLKVLDDGTVEAITNDAQTTLQSLINQYVALSGEIVKNTINSVFDKYPNLKR